MIGTLEGRKRTEVSVTEEYSLSGNGKKLTKKRKSMRVQGVTRVKKMFYRRLIVPAQAAGLPDGWAHACR